MHTDDFSGRHIGLDDAGISRMLDVLGYSSIDALLDAAVPHAIRDHTTLALPAPATEQQVTAQLRDLANANATLVHLIGLGYYDTITPPVIRRNVLESPAWYTAYTPYQPEISQGRLEALLNFQTMVADLTGLPVANASMLDEATAVAEAATLMHRAAKHAGDVLLVDTEILPQTCAVLRTRLQALGIDVRIADIHDADDVRRHTDGLFGVVLQAPGASGVVRDVTGIVAAAHEHGALVTVAADLLALTLVASPGDVGADVAAGTTQRFGVPMGYGGPHAGYLAVRNGLERSLPGRLVGVSVDVDNAPAYRLALQTREQHIRRERATSNICTAQVLLAVIAGMYAVWHGPEGLRAIAQRVHRHAATLADLLTEHGMAPVHDAFFDTIVVAVDDAEAVTARAAAVGINLGRDADGRIRIACDETTDAAVLSRVLEAFGIGVEPATVAAHEPASRLPTACVRTSDFLTHPVFHEHRSETAMLRYLRSLSDKDFALDRGMIPLGSCTMKLNGTTELEPITWPQFAQQHPFAPADQLAGTLRLIDELERDLSALTGYAAVSVQPNAGSQGELAGLVAIAAYHRSNGDTERDICLIPSSAHGTNAASAVMAGMRVVVVPADEGGAIDLDGLRAALAEHAGRVAAIMVTYPSTHGVYEDGITEVCRLVHEAGGQVYIDGANLNALVGVAAPGRFGGDVSHLNLHKTFCIPHGGGGPGVGPVAVAQHLVPFLPTHPLHPDPQRRDGAVGPVAAAPFGSSSILPISWAYIRLMGAEGLTRATGAAVLAANYVAARLDAAFPVLYRGANGLVAHECVLDVRPVTKASGITAEDIAKRLIDYGFHAPTLSFPVAGTLMVEPTESENLAEIDRFCDAMLAIRDEIDRVTDGAWPADDNPLINAPHPAHVLVDDWMHPYSRTEAVYPSAHTRRAKYWPPVRRIDGAYGDRNLACACPPVEAFAQAGPWSQTAPTPIGAGASA